MKHFHLLIIDPQRDFCDPDGALAVPGADKDMERLAKMINRIGDKIGNIRCTLDTHHLFDISHPIFWVNSAGKHPDPFTIITVNDVEKGIWKAVKPEHQEHALNYVGRLTANSRYPLCIWPPHCLIGTQGHNVSPILADALLAWEARQIARVDYMEKGANYKSEHYSAVQADVPDPDDPSTRMNHKLVKTLEEADMILVAGEALSHCVKFTVEDLADAFDEEHVRRMVLLKDCSSSVPGFEQQGKDFVEAMTDRGMRVAVSSEL